MKLKWELAGLNLIRVIGRHIFIVANTVWHLGGPTIVARFDLDGRLDSDFGASGIVLLDDALSFGATFKDLVELPDGDFMLVGGFYDECGDCDIVDEWPVAVRLNPDGSRDRQFKSYEGYEETGPVQRHFADLMSVTPVSNGKLLITGPWNREILRLKRNGRIDRSFGRRGAAAIPCTGATCTARILARQPSGRTLVTAGSENGFIRVAGFDESGKLDATFGLLGIATIDSGLTSASQPYLGIPRRDGGVSLIGNFSGPIDGIQTRDKYQLALSRDGVPITPASPSAGLIFRSLGLGESFDERAATAVSENAVAFDSKRSRDRSILLTSIGGGADLGLTEKIVFQPGKGHPQTRMALTKRYLFLAQIGSTLHTRLVIERFVLR
ncbi:MAG: hypothetical protein JHC87_06670 [Thermoleophilaceae bacterium]|nr:hypothetical protein [Thermoleophilaceae bacterium]